MKQSFTTSPICRKPNMIEYSPAANNLLLILTSDQNNILTIQYEDVLTLYLSESLQH